MSENRVVSGQELLNTHNRVCGEARDILRRKNADYSDGQHGGDCFGNLAVVESLTRGEVSTERGIVIRLCDKLSRLWTATGRDLAVGDESVRDTIRDIVNYAVLLEARMESRVSRPDVTPKADPYATKSGSVDDTVPRSRPRSGDGGDGIRCRPVTIPMPPPSSPHRNG